MEARAVPDRFLVAFSFAGAQRDLVRRLATELESRLGYGSVFYDDWFEHYINGKDADLHLQRLYHEQSELVVMCISGQYDDRPWTKIEYSAIRDRYASNSTSQRERLFLVRVGKGNVEGIHTIDIVSDAQSRPVSDVCDLIVGRLASIIPDTLEVVSRQSSTGWPTESPPLMWPLADHEPARASFEALVTEQSEYRLVCIEGASATGKSTMSNQMFTIGYSVLNVDCGRLDFKGTTGLDDQIDAFARSLGVARPQPGRMVQRLSEILDHVSDRAKPTLIVLDTYEDAGEGGEWVEQHLLVSLRRNPWLRVVVLGQEVPSCTSVPWAPLARPCVTLTPPSIDDWLDFRRLSRPQDDHLDREFVEKLVRAAGHQYGMVAQVLGTQL